MEKLNNIEIKNLRSYGLTDEEFNTSVKEALSFINACKKHTPRAEFIKYEKEGIKISRESRMFHLKKYGPHNQYVKDIEYEIAGHQIAIKLAEQMKWRVSRKTA